MQLCESWTAIRTDGKLDTLHVWQEKLTYSHFKTKMNAAYYRSVLCIIELVALQFVDIYILLKCLSGHISHDKGPNLRDKIFSYALTNRRQGSRIVNVGTVSRPISLLSSPAPPPSPRHVVLVVRVCGEGEGIISLYGGKIMNWRGEINEVLIITASVAWRCRQVHKVVSAFNYRLVFFLYNQPTSFM